MGRLLREASRDHAERTLQLADLDAWDEYMEACQAAGDRYEQVEAWAWNRLQAKLTATGARRVALKEPIG